MRTRYAAPSLLALAAAAPCLACSIATKDLAAIAAFQSDRIVLKFDELDGGPGGLSARPLDADQYAADGLRITSGDGTTNVINAKGAEGAFGPLDYWSQPNIVGGGSGLSSGDYRKPIRVTFTGSTATAIGAQTDFSGSNITLSAYRADDTLIEMVSVDQGFFAGIIAPDIAYAEFTWNRDQGAGGFTIDNLTYSLTTPGTCRPDCNKDCKLNINDFICFQAEWRAKSAYGDYNGDGKWNVNDFIAFQAGFRVGCS